MMKKITGDALMELVNGNEEDCCYIYIQGSESETLEEYFMLLKNKLRLNDSFSNNLNSYCDMMCDSFTYYEKRKIIFAISEYNQFLSKYDRKEIIEEIFNDDIIPFFEEEISNTVVGGRTQEIQVVYSE